MNWRADCRALLTPTLMFLAAASAAAQTTTPPVEEVLAHARAHVAATLATLPSVFCDEKISSTEIHNGRVFRSMTFDSVISVRKKSSGEDSLTESREVRLVNGKPPKEGKKYVLPITINGGFGLLFNSFLSSAYDKCNTYRIMSSGDSTGNLLGLEVTRKADSKKIAGCETLSESAVDRFWLDPASYEIQRIETMARIPNSSQGFKTVTGRNDFTMVQFGAKSYPLPTSARVNVTMEPESSEGFAFDAHYSNCHKFEVSSSILSDSVEEPR
jgi:hypothetical protein